MRFRLCAALAALFWLTGPACAEPGDERIAAARDAATRGDTLKLATFAASPTSHVLEPYVQYWLLSARIARTSETPPVDLIADFLNRNAGTWLAEKLRSEWVRRLGKEAQWPQFNAEYTLLAQPDQELQCFAILAGNASAPELRNALAAQWQTLMDAPDACQPTLLGFAQDGRMTTDDTWQRFRRLVETNRLTAARRMLGWMPDALSLNPASAQLALESPIRFLISPAAQMLSDRAGRELVLAAFTRMARSDVREAASRWRGFEDGFEEGERAYLMGQFGWMSAINQLPEAHKFFTQAISSAMGDEQRAWQVRAALRAADWPAVRAAIEAMPAAQRELPDWRYWLARAYRQQGRNGEANALLERNAGQASFYGILSTEALGRNFAWPQPATPPNVQEIAQVQQLGDIRRAEALLRLNMRTESTREWNWAMRGADDRLLLAAAEYARRIGYYDRAINTAERTRSQHDFSLRYLAPYYDVFSRQAQGNSLDVAWVYGLVRQESRFAPIARSGVGAQGLMQIMPATGRWIAKKIGASDYRPEWLTRIDTNVQLGSAYLSHVLSTLGNQPVVASAAYNAGPGRAKRWRDTKAMEGAIYAETIPITETREYVKKVMANAAVYAVLFNAQPTRLERRLGRVLPEGSDMALDPDEPGR
jgi:soluble lytic murein transglycosylase